VQPAPSGGIWRRRLRGRVSNGTGRGAIRRCPNGRADPAGRARGNGEFRRHSPLAVHRARGRGRLAVSRMEHRQSGFHSGMTAMASTSNSRPSRASRGTGCSVLAGRWLPNRAADASRRGASFSSP